MNAAPIQKRKRRFLRIAAAVALGLAILILVAIGAFFEALSVGWFDGVARDAAVKRIADLTGCRVEMGSLHFSELGLRAEVQSFTLHCSEPAGTPPFFHADSIVVALQIDSFWDKKFSLRELKIARPEVHVQFNRDGTSNLPKAKTLPESKRSLRERIFEVAVRHFELENGTILYNDLRAPLEAKGDNFSLAVDWEQSGNTPTYAGKLAWEHFTFAASRYVPFAADLSLKFSLEPNAFHVDQLQLKLPHSSFDVQAEIENFANPAMKFRYRAWLNLADIRTILRKPRTPGGLVDFAGEGRFANGDWQASGHYSAHDIALPYEWFHTAGIASRGNYQIARGAMAVPDFEAHVLGGSIQGRVDLVFHGMRFRVESHARDMDLATLLAALANPSFPVETFHWNSAVSVDAITTWSEDFKHLESVGVCDWTPRGELAGGKIPAASHLDYDYKMDQNAVTLRPSEISTPTSRVTFSGFLGAVDSNIEIGLDDRDLTAWDDFINRLRGVHAAPVRVAGRATWRGKLTGPLQDPTFAGHVHVLEPSYGNLLWDEAEGEITYSSSQFQFTRARARKGGSSAQIELWLELKDWGFTPNAEWRFDADLLRSPIDGLQEMFGWRYPVQGLLSGQFHGRGTRNNPHLTGLFDFAELKAWDWPLDRARGEFSLDHNTVRISNAELRLTQLGKDQSPSLLTGNFAYHFADANVDFDLTGAVIPIEGIRQIQTPRLPLAGTLSFQLRGSGPILAPVAQGTVRLVDFRAGQDVLGSFDGKLDSDGKRARVELNSAQPVDRLRGFVELGFTGQMPIYGELDVKDMAPDPLIRAGLHIEGLTGRSSMDGHLQLTGALSQPDSIAMDVNLSRLSLDLDYIKLENNGPVRLTYKRNEVRIEQATLHGTNTDVAVTGFARFAGDRAVDLNLTGKIDLRLLGGFVPRLDVQGAANINASIRGTFAKPRINGRLEVTDASANYDDFPAGLSNVSGAFVFDASRLLFENVRAEIGGGELMLAGSVTYGEGFAAVRYDISARATTVRIRYPVGMSWLAGGTLRFAGGMQSATLSGNISVQRLLMAQGFDLASLLIASKEAVTAPATSSPFLRNLLFDIQAKSSPDARVEWSGASFESEADLRVRGTWEHPILVGHIGLLNGDLSFAGNKYKLSRGDIDFSPVRLDPILNVQMTTTVDQYQVTLDISGQASKLTMNYRSDPPLPPTDIINLLALGQATESNLYRGSTALQTPQMGATTLLSEAISSQLGGRLEKLFGISRFRVDPFLAGTGNEQNAAARVTLEEQVGHNLTITYVTNVTGSSEEVIQVEYLVRPDVSIIALRDYNGTFGLDVVFKKRFK
ncbi:MAG TPA: translocation/assembly module TamB domain-containing protein [Candidatus Acidoferrales bacterium]|jgi:translocation and assembly module TamB|nr:translocation/assembly module TamB domain-containing protein [Candidatus Acidoferrales bacterium]